MNEINCYKPKADVQHNKSGTDSLMFWRAKHVQQWNDYKFQLCKQHPDSPKNYDRIASVHRLAISRVTSPNLANAHRICPSARVQTLSMSISSDGNDATPRRRPLEPMPRLHETLMGSMMARSTPRVLFHSSVVKHTVTALEIASALQALACLAVLFSLHVRYVRRDGCAGRVLAPSNFGAPVVELCTPASRYRFSHERGFLLLSDASLTALNVSIATVRLLPDDKCLGDKLSRQVLQRFVGYDTIAVNAFARLRRRTRRAGYVLALGSRRVVNLAYADPGLELRFAHTAARLSLRLLCKFGAVMTAVFIMCTTAALVAFTLKEVQLRMIKLTMDLQATMRSQQRYGRIVLSYALDALVFVPIVAGMLFFLFEFFDDQLLAFAVLCIAWLCEFATSGSTRHWISRLYLPRLFFCYFGGFHLYFFSFPLGFTWVALATAIAFMLHAALTVWNHCELPLLRRRDRSVRDRQWR